MPYATKTIQSLYYAMPVTMKNVMASIYGIRQRKERYGRYFKSELAFLEESQWWPMGRLIRDQKKSLEEFVRRAVCTTTFYSDHKGYSGYLSEPDIRALPILSKSEVRENLASLCARNLRTIPHRWMHTSGTTGKALKFPMSLYSFQREYAFRALHYSWGGVSLDGGDRVAICAGHPVAFYDRKKPPFWVYDWSSNWLFLSSYHLSERNLAAYIKELERFEPVMIHGYPSSVYLLALAYEKYGHDRLGLRSVFVSSETLLDYQRKEIEKAFDTHVFNWYGNAEMCANIVECEKGELHLKMEHSYVEIVNDNGKPANPGTFGRLICTGFGNDAFPLIRYDVGDVVRLSDNQTSRCGRGGILIDTIEGRVEEYILTPDGRYVGRLDHIFKDAKNVIEAQIYQELVDEVVLRIVKTQSYSREDEDALVEQTRIRLGGSIRIKFSYVDRIERTKNAKYKFIDSRLVLKPEPEGPRIN